MSKAKVWWTAIGSFLPFALFFVIAIWFALTLPFINTSYHDSASIAMAILIGFSIISFIIVGIDYVAMTIYCLYDAFNNPQIKDNQIAWVLVILLANFFGFPIYWFVNIYKARRNNEFLKAEPSLTPREQ